MAHLAANSDTKMANKDDFTVEWREAKGDIVDFRFTKGKSLYRLPWYRRILTRLLGRSHWHHVPYPVPNVGLTRAVTAQDVSK